MSGTLSLLSENMDAGSRGSGPLRDVRLAGLGVRTHLELHPRVDRERQTPADRLQRDLHKHADRVSD